ncbi:MAG: VOC family protein [Lachnospiraceae bacterium]|nr:VOC family protein [Lachnospiraceae bacterium]
MMRVHHVGWLVKRIEIAATDFEKLGFSRDGAVCRDTMRGIDVLFMSCAHQRIELVSPYCENSIVADLMKRYKNSPYHMCLITDNIEQSMKDLEKNGFGRISDIAPAPAIDGKNVVFLINSEMGMIELVEETGDRI